jgi:hypothetical protein
MIINLTQHTASADQRAAGVADVQPRERLVTLLTFDTAPSRAEISRRADEIAAIAAGAEAAMIGGAPFLMSALERALEKRGVKALYAFSVRESVEETLPDGSVRKVNVFKHAGFVPAA